MTAEKVAVDRNNSGVLQLSAKGVLLVYKHWRQSGLKSGGLRSGKKINFPAKFPKNISMFSRHISERFRFLQAHFRKFADFSARNFLIRPYLVLVGLCLSIQRFIST